MPPRNTRMIRWSRLQWKAFTESYDAPAAAAQSSPGPIVIGVGSLIAGMLAIGYVPALARLSLFRAPMIPVGLASLGAAATYTAWRHNATGRIGTLCMLIDTTLYTATLAALSVSTSGSFAVGSAVALALFLLAFPSRVYGLTALIAAAMCGPPLLITAVFNHDSLVSVIVWAGCVLALTESWRTRRRQAILAQNDRLRTALGAADKIADQSMETALAAALLDIGNFLHELRNTRAAYQANLQFVLEANNLAADTRTAMEEALQAQTRENQLISTAIEQLRRKGQPSATEFVLQDRLRAFVAQWESTARTSLDLPAQPFRVLGDPTHLDNVLRNLLRNAEKAGAMNVRLAVLLGADAASTTLVLQDDGPGLPQDILARLFQPFAHQGSHDGTGLGLYLTRRFVELLGGKIEAANDAERGAVFRIRLPGSLVQAERSFELSAPLVAARST